MGRRRRPAVRTALLAISTAASVLSGVPAAAQERIDLGLPPERDPDPVHSPLPDSYLRPPMAPLEEDGTRHPGQVSLGPDEASTPDRPVKDAEKLPREGGPNFDVFRTASGGEHVAVVFPEDVNVRDAQGGVRCELLWDGQPIPMRPSFASISGLMVVIEAASAFPM